MTRYRVEDGGAHRPSGDPLWQESQFFGWWDEGRGIGGIQRVGHLPNQGKANYWNALVCADGSRYLADVHDLELRAGDRHPRGLVSAGNRMTAQSERAGEVSFQDASTEIALAYEDFYPMCEVWEHGTGGAVEADMAAAHFETSGRVTGAVRMGDRRFEVDGIFHRDHSWGPRNWEALIGHRWVVGSAGPEFSFSSAVMLGGEDLVSGGYVIRHGQRRQATAVDVVIGIEPDNVTARNATVGWKLDNGETVVIDCQPVNGVMLGHGHYIESDQISRFTVRGEDIEGWCNVEFSMNHRLHNRPVNLAIGAGLRPGFSRARQRIDLFERLGVA
jgi:hypothetical protein